MIFGSILFYSDDKFKEICPKIIPHNSIWRFRREPYNRCWWKSSWENLSRWFVVWGIFGRFLFIILQQDSSWLIRTNADDPSSKAYGSLIDGIFDGHIVLGNGTSFTIEKASRYYSKDTRPNHFHSIIYADEMINHEKFRKKREANNENKVDGDDTGDDMMQFFCADETLFR